MTREAQAREQERRLKADLDLWQSHVDTASRIAARCDNRREKIRRLRRLPKPSPTYHNHS